MLEFEHGAIGGQVVGDFCAGTGMYTVASAYFDAKEVVSFELDRDAIEVMEENYEHYEVEGTIEHVDILQEFATDSKYLNYFDTILMNPPFGTKGNEGIDMDLIKAATKALKPGGQLFSLHKASTRQFIEKYVNSELEGCKGELL